MNSPATKTKPATNNLSAQLKQIGLRAVPARSGRLSGARHQERAGRLGNSSSNSPQAETDERSAAAWNGGCASPASKRFKPMADFDWNWPTKIERDVIERALHARLSDRISQSGSGRPQRPRQDDDRAEHLPCGRAGRALGACSVPPPRCWKTCIARSPEGPPPQAAQLCQRRTCYASTKSAICPSTTKPPTCSMKSSIAATSASR